MKLSIIKKILLGFVLQLVSFLWFIDRIGYFTKLYLLGLGRFSLYLITVFILLKGFTLDSENSVGLSSIPTILNPQTSNILGAANIFRGLPVLIGEDSIPFISAKSVYARDVVFDKVLLSQNSEAVFPPASTTKLMTALVALDLYELDELVVIPSLCTEIEGQKSGLYANDSFTAEDLIFSLLVNSGADAACALSLGKAPSVSYTDFMSKMNIKAKELGMDDTYFANPIGLDGENGEHVSTAQDLYKLAIAARKHKVIKEAINTREYILLSSSGIEVPVYNTNELLWTVPGSVGIKTGTTKGAGQVLIYEYNADGKDLIIIVMGSQNRFEDTENTLYWILNNYSWVI